MAEKIDALELIINVLREHEKEFDRLLDRLQKIVLHMEKKKT